MSIYLNICIPINTKIQGITDHVLKELDPKCVSNQQRIGHQWFLWKNNLGKYIGLGFFNHSNDQTFLELSLYSWWRIRGPCGLIDDWLRCQV